MEDTTFNDDHIVIEDIKKSYSELTVLKEIDLNIKKGEFVAVVGKSGCGKSTLLRLLAGLEEQSGGIIRVNGEPLRQLNKHARIMFQDGRLLPWKHVLDNTRIGLLAEKKGKAIDALRNVGLEEKMNDWPRNLSGGQQQRVALARALVHEPELLLLDEPLGALDALTRMEMQDLIEKLWKDKKFTAILVTHDVEEAVAIADRVILIEDGVIAMNQPINLSRPRERTQHSFSIYHKKILDRIKNKEAEDTSKKHGDIIELAAFHPIKNTSNT